MPETRGDVRTVDWSGVLTDNVFLEAKLGHHETIDEADPYIDAATYHDLTVGGLWSGGASVNPLVRRGRLLP